MRNSAGWSPQNVRPSRSLLTLILGAAALVALLTWWGGWALPVVIGSIFVMVMGHEFGHFITAKRAGMKVTDFFVGFGPVVWSITARRDPLRRAGVPARRLREGPGHGLGRGDRGREGEPHLPCGVVSEEGAVRFGRFADARA